MLNTNYLKNSFSSKILLLAITMIVVACGESDNDDNISLASPAESDVIHDHTAIPDLLEEIKERGKLIVITTNTPTTYYFDRDNQPTGPEYDMTQAYAKALQVDVEYKIYDSIAEVLDALRNKEGDIAAAGLTVTDKRSVEFSFGGSYQQTNEYLVCHRNVQRINNKSDLATVEIVVAADSSYIDSINTYKDIKWSEAENISTVKLMEQVAEKKIECTISDSILFDIERRYHTELQRKYTLTKESTLAWAVNKHNDDLLNSINDWLKSYRENNELTYTQEKYYGFVQIFDYVDTHKFLDRAKTRLPQYKDYFIDAAKLNDIAPSLLAAQSYQESHWNRKAKSPTGVRGIMMLTQPVAKSLGVTNRLHAKQNIYAGAKFQAKMKKMVKHVDEPGRSWLALAAYNVGRGHFRDAQALARKLGKNPDHWHDMKAVLPLLAEKKYYKDLRYGYARGNEPVRYVTRIRNYDSLLNQHIVGGLN
jgi:membrane-bound lytic murein transglycosylase F